jgi:hypothetical protein
MREELVVWDGAWRIAGEDFEVAGPIIEHKALG